MKTVTKRNMKKDLPYSQQQTGLFRNRIDKDKKTKA